MHRTAAVQFHIFQLVVVSDSGDRRGVGIDMTASGDRVQGGGDESAIQLDVRPLQVITAKEIEASQVKLALRCPFHNDSY